jgi:hypothetical protein
MGPELRSPQGSPPNLSCYRIHEEMPQNIVEATSKLKTFNLVPAVGERCVGSTSQTYIPDPKIP